MKRSSDDKKRIEAGLDKKIKIEGRFVLGGVHVTSTVKLK